MNDKDAIAEILKPRNSRNPMHRDELLERLHDRGIGFSDRQMRELCADMITEGAYLVGSSERGYFTVYDEVDLRAALAPMEARIESICVRKNCLKANYEAARSRQADSGYLFEIPGA